MNDIINHHCTIPLSQSKKSSSPHSPKTSVDNMKNETINHHLKTRERQGVCQTWLQLL